MDAIMVSNAQIQQKHFQQNLFERFINYTDVKDITLITRIKKNMKDKLILTSIGDLISFVAYIPYQKH